MENRKLYYINFHENINVELLGLPFTIIMSVIRKEIFRFVGTVKTHFYYIFSEFEFHFKLGII